MLVWWIVYVVDLSTKLMSMRTLVNLSAMVSKEKNAFIQKIIYYIWDYPTKSKATIQIKKRWLYGLNWMSFFPVVIFRFWILKFKQTILTREKRSLKAQKICHGVINCRTSFYCFEKSLIAFGTKCFQIYFWSLHSDKVALSHCPGIYIGNHMQSFVGDGVNAER